MKAALFFLSCAFFYWSPSFSQTAFLQGVVLNERQEPVSGAHILISETEGTTTNSNGFYQVEVPAGISMEVVITHLNYKRMEFRIHLSPGDRYELNPVLKEQVLQIGEITLFSGTRTPLRGITVIDPETIRRIPGANAGVENLLKSLPGVSSNNELSTQYAVRGGNYDENLVYVNGMEVYRPFLVRSGQQEGLSFVNPDLVRKVHFSAGGFQARYGDKLSSVLDITYRRPVGFSASMDASLLGGNLAVEGISEDSKFLAIGGLRYRDNSLFVEARETETNFHPVFADLQLNLVYLFSDRLEMSFLGNMSLNRYDYTPLTRQTNFGTLQDPKALLIYYSGQEQDRYQTLFGGFRTSYKVSDAYTAHFIASGYSTREKEYFDILASYHLGRVNVEVGGDQYGEVEYSEGIGAQLTHARNKLDGLILRAEHKGNLRIEQTKQVDYGISYTHEDLRDRLREYEIIDSAGFSVRPPFPDFANSEPYQPYTAPLEPFRSIRAFNESQLQRLQGFLQWSSRLPIGRHQFWYNLGIRGHFWKVNTPTQLASSDFVASPRAQVALQPDWKTQTIFRLSGGLYYQPPLYRALRSPSGNLNPSVKAQKALHLVLGQEVSLSLFSRPFTLLSEVYYKDLDNLNPYTLDNVRIRYAAENNAVGYAYGLDLRLNGEFVPGTESWVSIGYLKTEENIEGRGYLPRPTDQRLKFGMVFQDYVPSLPDLKMYLNLVYNTGLPGGSPTYADPYLYQSRLPDYKRADLGLFYLVKSTDDKQFSSWKDAVEEISIGIEIFNLFDSQNSITNTFVRDVYSKLQYAVPNYLTPRVYNLRIGVKL